METKGTTTKVRYYEKKTQQFIIHYRYSYTLTFLSMFSQPVKPTIDV